VTVPGRSSLPETDGRQNGASETYKHQYQANCRRDEQEQAIHGSGLGDTQ
jgi:hypothetical protein